MDVIKRFREVVEARTRGFWEQKRFKRDPGVSCIICNQEQLIAENLDSCDAQAISLLGSCASEIAVVIEAADRLDTCLCEFVSDQPWACAEYADRLGDALYDFKGKAAKALGET